MAKKSKQHKVLIQFVEYMISGGAYFWVGYVILLYLNSTFQHDLHWSKELSLWWATIISNTVGWTVNFVLQRFWVFNNKNLNKHKTQVTGRYIFITLVDFVLNYLILLGLENIGIQPKFGQFISSAFFTGWNWFWYKLWVFPEHMKKQKTVITPARLVAHRPHGHSGYHKMYR
jgi:putative flippase GtrA